MSDVMSNAMSDLVPFLPMLLLLMVIGALSGVIAGLLGVGGGIVLVPAFFYTFSHLGYEGEHLMQVCVATSLGTIIITSMRSVSAHHKKAAVDWAILKSWSPWIALGAIIGVLIASGLKSSTLQMIFGVVGLIVSLYMGFGRPEWRIGTQLPGLPVRGALGMMTGFLSTLMGIGGGSFGVPIMTLYGQPIHRAVATASGFGMLIAVPSVIGFLLLRTEGAPPWSIGAVNIPALVIVLAVSLNTTTLGVRLAHSMNPKPLKRVFALFLSVVALNMLYKASGL